MARRKTLRKYIPGQHGAWAMLVVPFLFGMISGKPVSLHALLFAFWLLSYLFSYPFLQWIRTRRWHTYRGPILIYGSLFVVLGLILAIVKPQLLLWIPLFVPPFLVNCWYAKKNRERAFANDLAAVLLFSLMVFVSHDISDTAEWSVAVDLFLYSLLYFTGTVFYVKTMIREKHNRNFYWYSVIYHFAAVVVSAIWFGPWLAAMLAILFVRAAWFPYTNIRIKTVGILEITFASLIVVMAYLTIHL